MKITHVNDEGSEPNAPSVSEMRVSQAKGNAGIGHATQSYSRSLKDFNQGSQDTSEGCDINCCCQPGEDDCPCCGT